MDQIKRIGRELKYKEKILNFYKNTMQTPKGHIIKWDYLHHNGAAAVVPVDADGKIYMVSQYRSGCNKMSLEIPAGCLNPGEDRKTAAARECEEEIGFKCENIELLLKFYSAFAYPPLFLVWEDEGSSARLVSFFSFTATLLLAVLVLVVIALAGGDGCDGDCADCVCD